MKKVLFFALVAFSLVACGEKTAQVAEAQEQISKKDVVIENIMNRRSIRVYKPEQVSKAQIDSIMQCAINAPSANNKQPWEVRIIQNAELLGKMKEINAKSFHNAPTVIIVAADKNNPFGHSDCGMLAQNILLSAEAMDLGTCMLGGLGRMLNDPKAEDILKALELPEGYEVMYGISLGYKAESPDAKPRETGKVKYID